MWSPWELDCFPMKWSTLSLPTYLFWIVPFPGHKKSNKVGALFAFSPGQLPFPNSYFSFQDVFIVATRSFVSQCCLLQSEPTLKHGLRIGNEEKLPCVAAFIIFLRHLRFFILHFALPAADFKRAIVLSKTRDFSERKKIKTHYNPNSGAQLNGRYGSIIFRDEFQKSQNLFKYLHEQFWPFLPSSKGLALLQA